MRHMHLAQRLITSKNERGDSLFAYAVKARCVSGMDVFIRQRLLGSGQGERLECNHRIAE